MHNKIHGSPGILLSSSSTSFVKFKAKIAFLILGQDSHFACPKIDFSFRHVTREGAGNHLGRGHRGVVIALVRQILPGFCFSNCNIGNAFKEGNKD